MSKESLRQSAQLDRLRGCVGTLASLKNGEDSSWEMIRSRVNVAVPEFQTAASFILSEDQEAAKDLIEHERTFCRIIEEFLLRTDCPVYMKPDLESAHLRVRALSVKTATSEPSLATSLLGYRQKLQSMISRDGDEIREEIVEA